MCISAAAAAMISAGLGTAGTLYSMSEQKEAQEEQQRILAAGEEEAQRIAGQGEELTQKFATDVFDPSKRDERYEQGIDKTEQSLASALAGAGANSGGNQAVGSVSGDYAKANAQSTMASSAENAERARMMARIGGGGLMFGSEAMMGGQLASDLGGVASRQRRNQRYTQNGVNGVNTGGSLGSALLSGAGSAIGAIGRK